MSFETDLPTEVGYYLFAGQRRATNRPTSSPPLVEIVRVFRNTQGVLMYTGADFFYAPKEARGAWYRVDDDLVRDLVAQGDYAANAASAPAIWDAYTKHAWEPSYDGFVRWLVEQKGLSKTRAHEVATVAAQEGIGLPPGEPDDH